MGLLTGYQVWHHFVLLYLPCHLQPSATSIGFCFSLAEVAKNFWRKSQSLAIWSSPQSHGPVPSHMVQLFVLFLIPEHPLSTFLPPSSLWPLSLSVVTLLLLLVGEGVQYTLSCFFTLYLSESSLVPSFLIFYFIYEWFTKSLLYTRLV